MKVDSSDSTRRIFVAYAFFVFGLCLSTDIVSRACADPTVDEYIARSKAARAKIPDSYFSNGPWSLPEEGVVVDEEAAIGIANIVGKSVLGEKLISSLQPLWAHFRESDQVWEVSGFKGTEKLSVKGGNILIEISRKDGRILRVSRQR